MSVPSKILIAVDFSETSDRALDTAIVYAKQFGAQLDLMHAFTLPVSFVSPYEIAIPEGFFEDARKAAEIRLKENLAKAQEAGVNARCLLIEAPATKAITDHIEEQGVDLLVMGSHGYTGLKHVLLGSVAERTLHRAACSVLVVK
ncbi:MAG: universal stress protein [bacterium]|nr:universal stress protein [bacterium]